jgi:cytochrome P450
VSAHAGLPPGPRLNPLGAWRAVYRPHENYAHLRKRFGDIVTIVAPHGSLVLTLSPEGARQVLTAEPDGYDAFYKEPFSRLAGSGSLWVLEGARHRRERRMLAPAVHLQRVREHGRAISSLTRAHTDLWQPGQRLRVYDRMLSISRDVILRLAFGIEHGVDLYEGRRILSKLLAAADPKFSFVPTLQRWWYPPWWRYRLAMQEFSVFVSTCLRRRRESGDDLDDVLGLMLRAQRDDPASIPDAAIRDELATILLSGHETTAVALSWALYELARHPHAMQRLREHVDAFGTNPDPTAVVKDPYLGAVCSEALRLHTILTEVARVTRDPRELLGYRVPAGSAVGVAICAIHHDPQLYSQPQRFMPERFLDRSYGPHEFLPFGGGHRRCLGAALANFQMRVVLATVVRDWQLEALRDDRDARHNIGMGPKHGIRMRVLERPRTLSR